MLKKFLDRIRLELFRWRIKRALEKWYRVLHLAGLTRLQADEVMRDLINAKAGGMDDKFVMNLMVCRVHEHLANRDYVN